MTRERVHIGLPRRAALWLLPARYIRYRYISMKKDKNDQVTPGTPGPYVLPLSFSHQLAYYS